MVDNVGYTPGIGATVAADDIGGALHQRIKVGVGVDGEATDLSASNPMPVEMYGLLNELSKAIDSLRVVDQQQRQRITLDSIASGLTLATITNLGTLGTVSSITNMIANAGMDREQYINIAAQTYALSIRPQLQFT
jgi:hypothetical protein